MPEITDAGQHHRRTTWRKRFQRKAKKLSKRIGKAIKYPFLCTVSCGKGEDDNLPVVPSPAKPSHSTSSASVGIQTDVPFIVDQLKHRGDTMKHRAHLNLNTNNNKGTVRVIRQSQSGSTSSSQIRGMCINNAETYTIYDVMVGLGRTSSSKYSSDSVISNPQQGLTYLPNKIAVPQRTTPGRESRPTERKGTACTTS